MTRNVLVRTPIGSKPTYMITNSCGLRQFRIAQTMPRAERSIMIRFYTLQVRRPIESASQAVGEWRDVFVKLESQRKDLFWRWKRKEMEHTELCLIELSALSARRNAGKENEAYSVAVAWRGSSEKTPRKHRTVW